MNENELNIAKRFAEKQGFASGVDYVGRWKPKGFNVYIVKGHWQTGNEQECPDIGLPTLILVKGGNARVARAESVPEIMAYLNT